MIQLVFGVRDTKAQAFMQPFFSNSVGAAIRAFGDAIADEKSPLGKHPADYILYQLGTFDDEGGRFEPSEIIKLLANGADFVSIGQRKPLEISENGEVTKIG